MTSLHLESEWPAEDILKLFQLIEPHKILYDRTSVLWQNKVRKGKLWLAIAKELDPELTPQKCRDAFVKFSHRYAKRIQQEISSGGTHYDPNLLWLVTYYEAEKEATKETKHGKRRSRTDHPKLNAEHAFRPIGSREKALSTSASTISFESLFPNVFSYFKKVDAGEPSSKRQKKEVPSVPQQFTSLETQPIASSETQPQSNGQASNMNLIDLLAAFPAIHEHKLLAEECITFGRQIALDLHRFSIQDRALARVKITRIMADLHQQQL